MRLLWIRYETKKKSNYALFLVIGEESGGLLALKSSAMDKGDVTRVRSALFHLEKSSVSQRIGWLKTYCPRSYRNAFRRLPSGKYTIISSHEPKATSTSASQ